MVSEQAYKFDIRRATLHNRDTFKPFLVTRSARLASLIERGNIHPETPVLTLERRGEFLAFLIRQMNYHHVAQGELAGEPYLVSF